MSSFGSATKRSVSDADSDAQFDPAELELLVGKQATASASFS